MPAKSLKQAKAARMALAARRHEISPAKLKGAAKEMYNDMTIKELKEFTKYKPVKRKKGRK